MIIYKVSLQTVYKTCSSSTGPLTLDREEKKKKEEGQNNQQLDPYGNLDDLRGKETVITHEETRNTRGKHTVTGGTLTETSPKSNESIVPKKQWTCSTLDTVAEGGPESLLKPDVRKNL